VSGHADEENGEGSQRQVSKQGVDPEDDGINSPIDRQDPLVDGRSKPHPLAVNFDAGHKEREGQDVGTAQCNGCAFS
jgi:hypothetical protein